MTIKFSALILAIFICTNYLTAQNVIDAVRYSNIQLDGDARFTAMGGAFGALGADASSNIINPAGYGRYSNSYVSITGLYTRVNAKSNFMENNLETQKGNGKLGNLSLILTKDISRNNQGFLFQQFGFSYNRLANFTAQKRYQGLEHSSLLDDFAAAGNGLSPTDFPPFTTMLAWNTYAIDPSSTDSLSYVANLAASDSMFHQRTINTKGGMGNYSFNYSINYINKLYFGVNLGLSSINYQEDYTHREYNNPNSIASVDSFNYSYALRTRGVGFNFNLGAIYVPNPYLRLGLAFHSKTYYNLKDDWSANMITYTTNGAYTIPDENIPVGNYKYRYQSAARWTGSVAAVFGSHGAISLDVDFVNYQGNKLRSTKDIAYDPEPSDYANQDAEIKEKLRPTANIRLGGEFVIANNYFIRLGYGFYPQPYKKQYSTSFQATSVYSAGIGVRFARICSFDFAYKLQNNNFDYVEYEGSVAHFKQSSQYFVGTLSFRF